MRVRSAATAGPSGAGPSGAGPSGDGGTSHAANRTWCDCSSPPPPLLCGGGARPHTYARALAAALQRRATDACAYPHRCTASAAGRLRTGLGGETDRQSALLPGHGGGNGSGGFVGVGAWLNALFKMFNKRISSWLHSENCSDFSMNSMPRIAASPQPAIIPEIRNPYCRQIYISIIVIQ